MSNEKPTQAIKILSYMFLHEEGITPMDALREFGCMRLGARIWELKHEHNLPIQRELVNYRKADGTPARYARYYIKKGE